MPFDLTWLETPALRTAAAWLANYLIHSTLLLTLALVTARALGPRRLAAQERLLRTVMIGCLLTASLQLVPSWGRPLAVWNAPHLLGASRAPGDPQIGRARPSESSSEVRFVVLGDSEEPATRGSDRVRTVSTAPSVTLAPEGPSAERAASGHVWLALTALWITGSAMLLLRLLVRHLVWRRRLRLRTRVCEGPLLALFRRLLEGVRGTKGFVLSSSSRVPVPIAHGIRRPEVCVPDRMQRDLPLEQQETVLAHESAHLLRRDPLWLLVHRWFEALLFVQPLNRTVCRRLDEIAELSCDDWAVRQTGRPITLARCLARVAQWNAHRPLTALAPTMASAPGLRRRVERLVARDYPYPQGASSVWLLPAIVGVLLLAAILVPRVSPAFAPPEEPVAPEPPAAPALPIGPLAPPAPVAAAEAPAGLPEPPEPPGPALPESPASPATLARPSLRPTSGSPSGAVPASPTSPASLVRWSRPVSSDGSNRVWVMESAQVADSVSEAAEWEWERLGDALEDALEEREVLFSGLLESVELLEVELEEMLGEVEWELDAVERSLEEGLDDAEGAAEARELASLRRRLDAGRRSLERLDREADRRVDALEDHMEAEVGRLATFAKVALEREARLREAAELRSLHLSLEAERRRADSEGLERRARELQEETARRLETQRRALHSRLESEALRLERALPALNAEVTAERQALRAGLERELAAHRAHLRELRSELERLP